MSKPIAIITGSSSGIGRATRDLLDERGWRTLGIDLRDADICTDLGDRNERNRAVDDVSRSCPDGVDAVVACAGISTRDPAVVSVNYFGTTVLLDKLRPLLARSERPRAVAVSSFAATLPTDEATVGACLTGDEARALGAVREAIAGAPGSPVGYASSKYALAQWIRRTAVTPPWAGAGILLNAVAPGTVDTPMMAAILGDAAKFAAHRTVVPCPLDRVAKPLDIANSIAFLISPENGFIVGQVLFVDGGSEALMRPERI